MMDFRDSIHIQIAITWIIAVRCPAVAVDSGTDNTSTEHDVITNGHRPSR